VSMRGGPLSALIMATCAALFASGACAAEYELPLTSTGLAGLTLLASTFQDAAMVFGPAKVNVSKRGLEAASSACYVSTRKGDETKLILKSESTGQGRFLTHYTLVTARRVRAGSCGASAAVHAGLLAVDDRLRLGMTKDQVRSAIGPPSLRNLDAWSKDDLPGGSHPNTWVYMATWHAPFSEVDQKAMTTLLAAHDGAAGPEHDYAWTRVVLNFRDSRLTRIDVSHGVGY